jgi:integrase/recombinase XerC
MSIYKTATGWQIKVMRDGHRFVDFVKGLDLHAEAVAIEAQAIADMARGLRPVGGQLRHGTSLTLQLAYDETWEHKWAYQSNDYQTKVVQYWKSIEQFFIKQEKAHRLEDVDTMMIDSYIRHLRNKGNKPKTINNKLTCLSSMLKHMAHTGRLKHPPIIQWESIGDNSRMRYYSPVEEQNLIGLADDMDFHCSSINDLLKDFIIVLFDTGMRPWREAHSFHCGWIQHDVNGSPVIRIPKAYSKTKKARDIPMTDRVKSILMKRSQWQKADHQPFAKLDYKWHCTRFWNELVRPVMNWEGDEVWYGMRHTFATRLVEADVNLKIVQQLMGHSNITQTARYAKVTDSALQSGITALQMMDKGRDNLSPNALPNGIQQALSA